VAYPDERPSKTIDEHRSVGLGEPESKDFIQFGRGGFRVCYAGSLTLGKVSFRCSLPSQQREMSGEGYVRWRSRTDETFGIEFAYLDPACRAWVLAEIAATTPRCFIPGSQ
jgi:hypothetical protein